jgi:predicted peroxiredoxin
MAEQQPADLVIILITGTENPKRLPSAFFLAAAAAASEQNVVIYFTGPATELLKKGVAEGLYPMDGGKSVNDFMTLARDNGVVFMGCSQSLDLNGMTTDDLAEQLPMFTPTQALPSLGTAGRLLTW